jgi:hypothetical protein
MECQRRPFAEWQSSLRWQVPIRKRTNYPEKSDLWSEGTQKRATNPFAHSVQASGLKNSNRAVTSRLGQTLESLGSRNVWAQ